VIYHTLFFVDVYLSRSEQDFALREFASDRRPMNARMS